MERDGALPILRSVTAPANRIPSTLLRAGRVAEDALPVGLGLVLAILFLAPGIPTLPGGAIGKLLVAATMLLLVVRQTMILRQRNGALLDAREGHEEVQRALADNRRLSAELQARIDEMRAIEPRLIEASKQKAVADLAASVAHQVNNPLTAVLGYAELLLTELPPGDEGRAELETIRAEALRARDIVQALLELAHGLPDAAPATQPDKTDARSGPRGAPSEDEHSGDDEEQRHEDLAKIRDRQPRQAVDREDRAEPRLPPQAAARHPADDRDEQEGEAQAHHPEPGAAGDSERLERVR